MPMLTFHDALIRAGGGDALEAAGALARYGLDTVPATLDGWRAIHLTPVSKRFLKRLVIEIDPSELDELADDPEAWVREAVADAPGCPEQTLRRLLEDHHHLVRVAARAALEDSCPRS